MTGDTLSDFPDRLSPMLVKELRQGLRAKTFVAVFLSLQATMALILLSAGIGASASSGGQVISSIIFLFFSLAVLVVQPLRGISAVSSEIKGNTIDMMVLTRLSASRIVYGKWFALVSQSALLLATIIPYLILRYFFGGMNLIGEIVLMVLIFLTSMGLTAVTVGLSGSSSVILRALVPMFSLPVLFIALINLFVRGGRGGSSLIETCALEDADSVIGIAIYLVCILYLGWSVLSLGASLIAPAAENHATLRRIIVLATTLVALCYTLTPHFDSGFYPIMICIIAFPAIATALTERSFVLPTVKEPFLRKGAAGRIAGAFLYPGWPAGVRFTALLSALFILPMMGVLGPDVRFDDEEVVAVLSLLAACLFPALVLILMRTDEGTRFSTYFLLSVASGVFTLIIYGIAESLGNDELMWFFVWNPPVLMSLSAEQPVGKEMVPHVSAIIAAGYMLALLCIAAVTDRRAAQTATAEEP